MSLDRILSSYNFKEVAKLNIDNENRSMTVSLSDDKGDVHEVVLQDVDNYQVFDSSIYDEIYHVKTKGEKVNFTGDTLINIGFVQVNRSGNVTKESFAAPNFIVDSKDRSILVEADNLEINGVSYSLRDRNYN